MNTAVMSDEQIQDLFDEAFEKKVGEVQSISEFESKCVRETGKNDVGIELLVAGLAGTPTYEDFVEGKIEENDSITISMEERGELKFAFNADDSYVLNTNDYILVYASEEE